MLDAERCVRLATLGGAEALGLADDVGSLEPGKSADFIAVDVSRSHFEPIANPYSALVYGANQDDVFLTVVGGRVLYRDRVFTDRRRRGVRGAAHAVRERLQERVREGVQVGAAESGWWRPASADPATKGRQRAPRPQEGQVLAEVGLRGHGLPHGGLAREHPAQQLDGLLEHREQPPTRSTTRSPGSRSRSPRLPAALDARLDLAEALRRRANQSVQDSQEREDFLRASAAAYEAYVKRLAKTEGTKAERREAERQQIAALEDLVSVYLSLGDYDAVTRVYGVLTELRPNNADYFYDMGRVAINAGRHRHRAARFRPLPRACPGLAAGRAGAGVDRRQHAQGRRAVTAEFTVTQ